MGHLGLRRQLATIKGISQKNTHLLSYRIAALCYHLLEDVIGPKGSKWVESCQLLLDIVYGYFNLNLREKRYQMPEDMAPVEPADLK